MLYNGEHIGSGQPPPVDIAVDPVEGTALLAEGRPGAIAVIALAPRETMFDPGSCVYMNKLVVGPVAADAIDLDAPINDNLRAVASAKNREVRDLTVVMLDRERHDDLKRDIRETGARLQLIHHGDVAAAVRAAWSQRGDVDMLIGIGGTPEGVITACAVKCIGGQMLGRLWPRNDDERRTAEDAGYDLDRVLTADDLVDSDDVFFVCTGITGGGLVDSVTFDTDGAVTESLVMRSKSGTVRVVGARHQLQKLREYASVEY